MTTAVATLQSRRAGLISRSRSSGQSDSARELLKLREQVRQHFLHSISVRSSAEAALDELDAMRTEASRQGWDGYGGQPVSSASYDQAKALLEALPTTSAFPEISVAADGDVALDWFFGPRQALTLTISGNGRLTFAWMNGHRSYRGTDWFDEGIPGTIAEAISYLTKQADVAVRTA